MFQTEMNEEKKSTRSKLLFFEMNEGLESISISHRIRHDDWNIYDDNSQKLINKLIKTFERDQPGEK